MSTEQSAGDLAVGCACQSHNIIKQRRRLCRRGSAAEPGPVTAFGVGCERKLRHQQQRAATLAQIQVHASGRIGKHAVIEYPLQQPLGGNGIVAANHADQGQQSRANLPDNVPVHPYAGLGNPLNQCDHAVVNPHTRPYTLRPFWTRFAPLPALLFIKSEPEPVCPCPVAAQLQSCSPPSCSARAARLLRPAMPAVARSFPTPVWAATASKATRTSTRPTACRSWSGSPPST